MTRFARYWWRAQRSYWRGVASSAWASVFTVLWALIFIGSEWHNRGWTGIPLTLLVMLIVWVVAVPIMYSTMILPRRRRFLREAEIASRRDLDHYGCDTCGAPVGADCREFYDAEPGERIFFERFHVHQARYGAAMIWLGAESLDPTSPIHGTEVRPKIHAERRQQ